MTEGTGIGAALRRKEDNRFLTGKGRYVDDINRHGQAYITYLYSPHARAKINGIDTATAKAAPGVLGVFTAADVAADGVGGPICGWVVTQKNGEPHTSPAVSALASDRVNHVGEHVAAVVAETLAQARDAADLIEVDYEPQAPLMKMTDALAEGAPQLHDDVPGNLCFDFEIGDKAATEAAFANAHHVTKIDLVNNRLIPNAIEPRACIGEYDEGSDSSTLYVTSQNPHVARLVLAAFMGLGPENKLRVVAPDVGGGFGSKIYVYRDEIVALWAAKKLRRPVKWTGDRSSSFLTDAHGRDHETHAELACDENGKFLGLRVSTLANVGAYNQIFSTATPSYLYGCLLSGQYMTPAIYGEVKTVFTNTCPVDAYRGAGRPEATLVVERLVDKTAREMGIERTELRRRNFIPEDQFPYQTPCLVQYDSGHYAHLLDRALDGYAARKAESEARGKLRGIGFSTWVEACGLAPSAVVGALGGGVGQWESANIKFNPTGSVTVYTGSHSHGQGHETAFAQIVSEHLGVPVESVEVIHGDTGIVPFGMGTYGSRSGPVGGAAVYKAAEKIIEKGRKIAAHLLEASAEDVEYSGGTYTVAGTDQTKTMAEIAFAAYVPHNYPHDTLEPGLDETAFFDPLNFTYPSGAYVAEVEVDPETGVVTICDWTGVDDVGTVINPMIVKGQLHGGFAQGIGQALFEECVYDATTTVS
jgi:carbon-monoxide dehydrogenase large subunit